MLIEWRSLWQWRMNDDDGKNSTISSSSKRWEWKRQNGRKRHKCRCRRSRVWLCFFSRSLWRRVLSGLLLLWSLEQRIILKISRLMKEQYGNFVIKQARKKKTHTTRGGWRANTINSNNLNISVCFCQCSCSLSHQGVVGEIVGIVPPWILYTEFDGLLYRINKGRECSNSRLFLSLSSLFLYTVCVLLFWRFVLNFCPFFLSPHLSLSLSLDPQQKQNQWQFSMPLYLHLNMIWFLLRRLLLSLCFLFFDILLLLCVCYFSVTAFWCSNLGSV